MNSDGKQAVFCVFIVVAGICSVILSIIFTVYCHNIKLLEYQENMAKLGIVKQWEPIHQKYIWTSVSNVKGN